MTDSKSFGAEVNILYLLSVNFVSLPDLALSSACDICLSIPLFKKVACTQQCGHVSRLRCTKYYTHVTELTTLVNVQSDLERAHISG